MIRFKHYISELHIWQPTKAQTKGIARGDMPQVRTSDYEELIEFLRTKDIKLKKMKVKASALKATQRNFNVDKITSAAQNYSTLHKAKPIIVSSDNYIIDGHHRWLGAVNVGGDIDIYKANVNVNELLDAVKEFPKSFTKNINEETNDI